MADFKCVNEKCENFDKIDIIPEYKIKIVQGEVGFFFDNNKRITCPVCGEIYVRLQGEVKGFPTGIAVFNNKSPQEKREILKKRANAEWNRNKGMRDYAEAADRQET